MAGGSFMQWNNAPKIISISLTVLLSVLFITPFDVQAGLTNEIMYRSWDESNWRARRAGNRFEHSPQNSSQKYFDTVLRFLGWDGRKLAARWERDAFLIAPDGDFGSGRAWSLDFIAFQGWEEPALTAQWNRQHNRFEVKPATGAMIVAPSANLSHFTQLSSQHSVCGSSQSLVALKDYVKKFNLRSPKYIQMPASDYVPALQQGVCQIVVVFATREFARSYAERISPDEKKFKILDVP
jgi:hypothetical protein